MKKYALVVIVLLAVLCAGQQTVNKPPLNITDSATTAPLKITERSSAPSAPAAQQIYLDDGTNTVSGNPCFRRYTGTAWEDLGSDVFFKVGVTTGIAAASPGIQGDVPLTTEYNVVTVVGTNGDAVTAPAAAAGRPLTIWNADAAQTLEIWPASGDDLGAGVNTAIALVANDHITCVAIDDTTWRAK